MKKAARSKTPAAKKTKDARPAFKLNERGLPEHFRKYFDDCDFDQLSWAENGEAIALRILQAGQLDDYHWVIGLVGKAQLRNWVVKNRGIGLNAIELNFWCGILRIGKRTFKSWLLDSYRLPFSFKAWARKNNPKEFEYWAEVERLQIAAFGRDHFNR